MKKALIILSILFIQCNRDKTVITSKLYTTPNGTMPKGICTYIYLNKNWASYENVFQDSCNKYQILDELKK
jgi:hypothetical protein